MSGFHWSDDPVLSRQADNRDRNRAAAKELGYTIRHTSTIRTDGVAICGICHALVWMGDFDTPSAQYLQAHHEWHASQK